MENLKSTPYPSIGQAVVLSLIVVAFMLILSPVVFLKEFVGQEMATFIYYLLSMGLPFWILYSMRKSNTGERSFNFKIVFKTTIPLILLATLGIQYSLTLPISTLIPMSDSMRAAFSIALGNPRNIFSIATLVILAPIFEELIFRGIILNGLLKRYSPLLSIVVSSLLFAAVHLNPWQFVSAFILGLFIGWVYLRTKSILLAIIIHAFNNFAAILPEILGFTTSADKKISLSEYFGGTFNYALIIILAGFTAITCIYLINKSFIKDRVENHEVKHSEEA
ncbi:MAG: type II CAAX endopeptidase family protein [Tenuifilaceae bacterium]|jgi:membrane protease YdiL (CAAX protease family)|nr:type II CAAX endopeptidase family protein [Tenuifilaceae bacterium]